jgi:hypothetical protein
MLEVTRMRTIKEEIQSPNTEDLSMEFYDDESLIEWYIGVRAVESFRLKHHSYPNLHSNDHLTYLK